MPAGNCPFPARRGPAAALLLTLGFLTLTGCGPGGPLRWQLHDDVVRPRPGVVIILVDGCTPDRVAQGCAAGWLPNIARHFGTEGLVVNDAITTIPSITYAAIGAIVTGSTPAQHGVIGNRWFDPERALFRDYATIPHYQSVNDDLCTPLIYERLQPDLSASIQAAHFRGVSWNIPNWAGSGVRWYFRNYTSVDKLTASTVVEVAQRANWAARWPKLLMCYMPGVDSVGHDFGPDSPAYRRALENADHQIGRIMDWLDDQGLLTSTYVLLISDHGLVPVHAHTDLRTLVRERWGRQVTATMQQDGTERERRAFYAPYDTVLNDQDGRRASLHFRVGSDWAQRPTPQQVTAILKAPAPADQLWNQVGVDVVAYLAGPDEAIVRHGALTARIVRTQVGDDWHYAYVAEPDDALGYLTDPARAAFVQAGAHDARAWLNATADGPYPDLVPQLIPLLHLRTAGQVVAFAAAGYSFIVEHGGHGGLTPAEMHMTFRVHGPTVTPGSMLPVAHVTDIVPTILEWLHKEGPSDACLAGTPLPIQRATPVAESANVP